MRFDTVWLCCPPDMRDAAMGAGGERHGRCRLEVGVLEDGMQSVGGPCPLVDQVDAIAGEVAQVASARPHSQWQACVVT
jgi:hypothetical protein